MASPSVTTSTRGMKGIGGTVTPATPTTKLVALWKMTNGSAVTDKTLLNSASGEFDLRTRGTNNVSAAFWGTSGYGTFSHAVTDFFGSPDATAMDIGALGVSFIFSCRVKSSAAATPSAVATIFSKRHQGTGVGHNLYINSDGTLLHQCREVGGTNQNLAGGTNICDGNEHSIVFAVDRTANRVIYLDGFNDDYASGESDMTTSSLDGDMSTGAPGFQIGGSSTLLDSGTINSPLFTAGVTISLRDCHLYMVTGALPSNLNTLTYYLSSNVYSPIPGSIW